MSAAVDNVDGAASDSTNKDDNTVGMNQAQTTKTETEDEKTKRDAEQKVAVRQKRYHLIDTTRDIYGRVPGNEPTYPIPCPNCKRELATSRFCQHLEKCMGLGGRGVSSSHCTSGSQAKRR